MNNWVWVLVAMTACTPAQLQKVDRSIAVATKECQALLLQTAEIESSSAEVCGYVESVPPEVVLTMPETVRQMGDRSVFLCKKKDQVADMAAAARRLCDEVSKRFGD